MRIRDWKLSDTDLMNDWLIKRDMSPVDAEDLPPRGWVVIDNRKMVGAVFLRLCEGGYAIMDSMVNDPEQTPEKRNAINERLFLQIFKVAKNNELRGIFGTTLDKGTLERAVRHGFLPSAQTLLVWRNEQVM